MTETKTYLDLEIFENGRVAIYRRTAGQKPTYQVRIRVPGVAGYVIKSAGTSNRDEAYRFAMTFFDDLRLKIRAGEDIKSKPASWVIDTYVKLREQQPRYASTKVQIGKHLRLFVGKSAIERLDSRTIADYFADRATHKRYGKSISLNTLNAEAGEISRFLRWCREMKYIREVPTFTKPRRKDNPRPSFSEKDWNKLTRHARKWIADAKHSAVLRDRVMLWNFVLVLANTGIRVGEARSLRWSNIRRIDSEVADKPNVIFAVKGKTGAREVVARTSDVWTYLVRIADLRRLELNNLPPPDSLVFCHRKGEPIGSFKKGFGSLLRSAGVEKNRDGSQHTLYSLRHTYATFRLYEGVNHYTLARNMGTSVAMIEKFYGHTSNVVQALELTKSRTKKRQSSALDFMEEK